MIPFIGTECSSMVPVASVGQASIHSLLDKNNNTNAGHNNNNNENSSNTKTTILSAKDIRLFGLE